MEPFNRANEYIRLLLVEDAIFPIDLEDTRIEGWLYQSEFPFQVLYQEDVTKYQFRIRLYQYDSKSKSLKLVSWNYKSASGTQILFVVNDDYENSINQMGRDFIKNEKFLCTVKPLLLTGFREIAFNGLLGNE